MATLVITLLVALAPALVSLVQWLLARKPKPELTPAEQHKENEQKINKAIATGNERSVNLLVEQLTHRMRKSDEVRSDISGQGNKEG